jgi:multisubunit Na+/H+ antiporter MnhB subunit
MFYILQVKFSEKLLVYLTHLLVGTLGIIFFAIFFRESPRIVKVCKIFTYLAVTLIFTFKTLIYLLFYF